MDKSVSVEWSLQDDFDSEREGQSKRALEQQGSVQPPVIDRPTELSQSGTQRITRGGVILGS